MTAFVASGVLRVNAQLAALLNATTSYGIGTPAATAFTLSGPTSGVTGTASTFTVTPNGQLSSTVVVSMTAPDAALSVSTLTFTAGTSSAQSFTVTRVTDGTTAVSMSNNGGLTEFGDPVVYTSFPASSSGYLPANTITTGSTASTGVTYGQPFKQGAVGAGASLSGRQLNPLTYWPDGSVKHGIVSRIVSGATSYDETLQIGTATAGSTLTTSDLPSGIRTTGVSITAGGYGSVSWSGSDWDSPFQWSADPAVVARNYAWFSGPVCSSWIYRKPLPSDSHLTAWLEVRLWSNGQVEVFPWVENGYMFVANPTNKSDTYTFSMGGPTRFSGAIDLKHHCRAVLLKTSDGQGSATTFSHWLGTDPQARCVHDRTYLMATKMVPNYGGLDPTNLDTLIASNDLVQHYEPMTIAGDSSLTGAAGGSGSVISARQARYITANGDLKAWKGMMAHALSAASWSHHYRDENTNRPFSFSTWPQVWVNGTGIPAFPATSGGGGQGVERPAMSHLPGYAYLPFLTTGRYWFMEEQQFISTFAYTLQNYGSTVRDGSKGIYTGQVSGNTRLAAWSLNALAHAAAITPTVHALQPDFVASWQHNTDYYLGAHVTGTLFSGTWVSAYGEMGQSGPNSSYLTVNPSSAWHGAAWMQNYLMMVFGCSATIGIPQSASSLTAHLRVRDHVYKQVISRADDGLNGRPKWQRMIAYSWPIGTDNLGLPPDTWYTPSQSYAEQVSAFNLNDATITNNLKEHPSASPVQGDANITGVNEYGATAMAGLSLAVEDGAPGAVEARARVTGAGNYATAVTPRLRDVYPDSSMVPREVTITAPAYLRGVPLMQWVSLPSFQSATSIHAGGLFGSPIGVVNAYSGGALRQRSGHFMIHGGGHNDGFENTIYGINLFSSSPQWERLWGPSSWDATINSPPMTIESGTQYPYLADGNPASSHTYYSCQYDEIRDRFMRLRGSSGRYPTPPYTGLAGGNSITDSWNWGAANWNPAGTHPYLPSYSDGPTTVYDPLTGEFFMWAQWYRYRLNPAGTAWSYTTSSSPYALGETAGVYDTKRKKVYIFGLPSDTFNGTVTTWDPSDNSVSRVTCNGVQLFQRQMGAAYDPVNDCVWLINQDSQLIKYDIATNTATLPSTTGSAPLTTLAYYGSNPKGYFNRFQYVYRLRALVMLPAYSAPCFVIRTA